MSDKKLKYTLQALPMVIIYIAVIFIYYSLYSNTIEIIESEYNTKLKLIEQSIYNETKYTEIMSEIVESEITTRMEEYSLELVEKYKEDQDVLNWDLEELKEGFKDVDIYIIDRATTVINSTIEEEVGLTFENYTEFSQTLKRRINGRVFVSDKINFSVLRKELKKYSFMPTPDNEYLIELSINVADKYPAIKNLNVLYLAKNLKEEYPFIEDMRVFKYNIDSENSRELETSEEFRLKDKGIDLKLDQDKLVKKAIETNEIQENIIEDYEGNLYTFKYIPYTVQYDSGELEWWNSYVIEVLYNDEVMIKDIGHQRALFIRSMIVISILYFVFSFLILYFIYQNKKIAYEDHLTKLANRKKFEEVLEEKMKEADKKENKLAILFFDLDKFKKINDTFGHSVGDKVLQEVANKIKKGTPKRDIASRLGGDEFISLVSNVETEEDIVEVAKNMSDLFETPLKIDSREIPMKPSIGISIYPDDGDTAEELIVKADHAMYKCKENGQRYKIYKEEDENNS